MLETIGVYLFAVLFGAGLLASIGFLGWRAYGHCRVIYDALVYWNEGRR